MKIKKIGILTSGGDAPGMNSALFGVFSACREKNIELVGFRSGYDGLIDNDYVEVTFSLLDGKINSGGSVLKSSRCPRFMKETHIKKAVANLHSDKIDALIVLGGDGSTRGAIELRNRGIKTIILPCTIDNDMNTSHCIGFNTAVNNIVNAVDNISDSLSAFNYGGVIKVMGRACNDLIDEASKALHTNLVVKDSSLNLNNLVKQIKATHTSNHLPTIVLVREDCVDCEELAKTLQEKCKFQFRAHILGYIQRGGKPTAFDRSYAYSAGINAVDLLLNGEHGFAYALNNGKLEKIEFETIIKK